MENPVQVENIKIENLLQEYPSAKDFFNINGLPLDDIHKTVKDYIAELSYVFLEDRGVDRDRLLRSFGTFMKHMKDTGKERGFWIHDITILGGKDKNGTAENLELTICTGEIICIVGPTGSGKSRLLADIEWMAQKDTPTRRQILIDGRIPPKEWRFSFEHKLVAQLSQNMNFVMDISVYDFIKMHAQSRMIEKIEAKVEQIIVQANELSGEEFQLSTPLTSLSGGQSRALMVADTAFLSTSPIVLIDELENAGINRKKAMELLVGQDKIVLIATHDPLLALRGSKRIIIKNGGIHKVIETTQGEKKHLEKLEEMDKMQLKYREMLRNGDILDGNIQNI